MQRNSGPLGPDQLQIQGQKGHCSVQPELSGLDEAAEFGNLHLGNARNSDHPETKQERAAQVQEVRPVLFTCPQDNPGTHWIYGEAQAHSRVF